MNQQGGREPLGGRPGISHSDESVSVSPHLQSKAHVIGGGREGGREELSPDQAGQGPCVFPAMVISNSTKSFGVALGDSVVSMPYS